MITCILEGMQENTHIHVNYDKVREITQGEYENPALYSARLTEAVQKYTNLDITTPAGLLYLHIQFIGQSAPDIRSKLRQLEKGTETPQRDFLEVGFKVLIERRRLREKRNVREKLNMPFWRQQLREEINLAHVIPERDLRPPIPGPCFRCNEFRTLGKGMPTPAAPPKACPTCGQWGHWKMDCPQGRPGDSGEIPTSPQNPSPTLRELFQ